MLSPRVGRAGRVRSNLPAEVSAFVGRRRDLAEVRQQLAGSRLVTLTGVGGVGKTRLALRVASAGERSFPDGVWLVSLSDADGTTPVAELVAQVLGVRDEASRPHADSLAAFLRDKRLLLLLDACERHTDECGDLADQLLRASPGLRILATGRVPLHVPGEQVHPLPPMPADGAADLFRARVAAMPGVELSGQDAAGVGELCRRLDGIPLAVELAAACLLTLSVRQVAERLDDRFRLLTARHQTLRAVIDGSYELCRPAQRLLWARLSVFAGEFDLAAVEAICTDAGMPTEDVPHHLGALVEQSVVTRVAGGGLPRFHLLDTLREYGSERLDDLGETQLYRRRHREHYAALAFRAEQSWCGPDQISWFHRLRREHANLRAALDTALAPTSPPGAATSGAAAEAAAAEAASGAAASGAAASGADMAARLWFFWIAGGFLREGRRYLERALAAHPRPTRERRRALWACAFVAGTQGDLDRAEALAAECLTSAGSAGDTLLRASALETLGMVAAIRGDLDLAVSRLTESLGLTATDDTPEAVAGRLRTMPCLGVTRIMRGDVEDAVEMARGSEDLCRELGERWQRSYVDYLLALALRAKGDPQAATDHVLAATETKHEFRDVVGLVMCTELLAGLLADRNEGARAARLLGAAETLWDTFGLSADSSPFHTAERRQCADQARRQLGEAAYTRNLQLGRTFDLARTVACALGRDTTATPGPPKDSPTPTLTRREAQIADLIAEGLSNREIADRLSIARRTAESHVENILTKLGFRSRTQVAAWVAATRRS